MKDRLHLDFETFSTVDLKRHGSWRYAIHESTELLYACWAYGQESVKTWCPAFERAKALKLGLPPSWHYGRAVPAPLAAHVRAGVVLVAHNASFERAIWQNVVVRRHDGPSTKIGQFVCTAARAAAAGLPRSLEHAGMALDTNTKKDMEGAALLKLFAFPRKPTKTDARIRILPEEEPDKFKRLGDYCGTDVLTERDIDEIVPELNSQEQKLFAFDMQINERGMRLDVPLIRKASTVVAHLEKKIVNRVKSLTVTEEYPEGLRPTQRDKFMGFFRSIGVELENMQADYVRKYVRMNKSMLQRNALARELLALRIEAGRSSTKKFVSMLAYAHPEDWRARGTLLFYGSHTGRWCAQAGTPVVVEDHDLGVGWKRIENVKPTDRLWDGVEWVSHDGVVPSGVKETIMYDGVFATPEHDVWLADGKKVSLGVAQQSKDKLMRSLPHDFEPAWTNRSYHPRLKAGKRATYDILNAGPRNRFALAGGQIVSNSGKGIQPHNFMRGLLKLPEQLRVFKMLELEDPEIFDLFFEFPISTIGQVMRGFIIPADGHIFKVVDYSSIEARVLSWLAQDEEMLEAFRKNYDPYRIMAAKLFGVKYEDVTDDQRRIGKNLILGCVADTSLIKTDLRGWIPVLALDIDEKVWDGVEFVEHKGVRFFGKDDVIDVEGLTCTPDHMVWHHEEWVPAIELQYAGQAEPSRQDVCDIRECGPRYQYVIKDANGDQQIVHNCGYGLGAAKFVSYSEKAGTEISEEFAKTAVRTYRQERRKIVQFWYDVERAAIAAVREKRTEANCVKLRNLKFYVEGRWFCVQLPSGRKLRYYKPQVKVVDKFGEPAFQLSYKVEFRGRLVSESTYGGKLVENIVQAIARDFMVNGMFNAEKAGYPIIGTVHDELITEPPIGYGSVAELERVVCEMPDWGAGCPINAKGFESPRYRKD